MDDLDVVLGFWLILGAWVAVAFAGVFLMRFLDPFVRDFGRKTLPREPAE